MIKTVNKKQRNIVEGANEAIQEAAILGQHLKGKGNDSAPARTTDFRSGPTSSGASSRPRDLAARSRQPIPLLPTLTAKTCASLSKRGENAKGAASRQSWY